MTIKGAVPIDLRLIRKGKEHVLSFFRQHTNGTWDIRLDGMPWATGRRIQQGEWVVEQGAETQQGRTLEQTASAIFYSYDRSRLCNREQR